MARRSLIAIDIGNSRAKLGLFDGTRDVDATGLPKPIDLLMLEGAVECPASDCAELTAWLAVHDATNLPLVASSVSRPRFAALSELVKKSTNRMISLLTHDQLAIRVATREPARTGMDRLTAAVAVNRLRRADRAAIVIDLGTAITVDLVTEDGTFAGGAILPGVELGARALADGTDALPHLALDGFDRAPDAVGTDTHSAIEAGLHWGTVGAIREIIERQADRMVMPPQVFVTGGNSPQFARLLSSPDYAVRHIPHLVLAGVALTAAEVMP